MVVEVGASGDGTVEVAAGASACDADDDRADHVGPHVVSLGGAVVLHDRAVTIGRNLELQSPSS